MEHVHHIGNYTVRHTGKTGWNTSALCISHTVSRVVATYGFSSSKVWMMKQSHSLVLPFTFDLIQKPRTTQTDKFVA